MPLFLFVILPITELWLLFEISDYIGGFATIMLVLCTASLGIALLRHQGTATLLRARERLSRGELPAQEMLEGILLAIGGALLLAPGILTDSIGFTLLLPFTRRALAASALLKTWGAKLGGASHFHYQHGHTQDTRSHRADQDDIIEGEYVDETQRPKPGLDASSEKKID